MKKHISEITDINRLRNLLEKFTVATGIGTSILDMDANVLVATGWQDICTKFHRVHPETCKNCLESDLALANDLKIGNTYNMYKCPNGLTDVAVPIIINNEHLGNLFIGQFLSQEPDLDFFRTQASNYGFDEKKYLKALSNVQILSPDEAKKKIEFLLELAMLIGDMGITKMSLMDLTGNLEQTIEERTIDLKEAQIATLSMMQDAEEARKEAEESNRNLEKTMLNLERSNQELEQFAYVASHDLQEPLRMVASFTQLLEKRYASQLDADAKEFIGYAVDGANRMQKLINDLLDFSRITTRGKEFTKLDVSTVLAYTMTNLHEKIRETWAIVTNEELPFIKGDESQLIRLFQNLIDNAIKFRGEESPRIHITFESMPDYWQIAVKDNGIGINPEYAERIFQIFQRLNNDKKYPGTGIGLAVCKRIVERHGGKIWVESEEGNGSTFYFTIKK